MPKSYKLPASGQGDERDLYGDPNRQTTQVADPQAAATPSRTRNVTGGNFGNVGGFDPGNFSNPEVQTLKYRAGRVLSDYPTTAEGIRAAMRDPRWLGDADLANATYGGADRINFGGAFSEGDHGVPVNEVDVLQAFDNGVSENPWQWLDQDAIMAEGGAGGGGGFGGGGFGGGGFGGGMLGLTDVLGEFGGGQGETLQEKIQRELEALRQGAPSPMNRDTLLSQLEGR